MTKKIHKAVIPAAGFGTRFLPATKAIPKEMLALVDKPLIQYGVEEALAAGIDEIIIVTSRGKSAIEDHFDMSPELESSLEELERIVKELEKGDLPLERSLELFESGMRLSTECKRLLEAAESRVELLTKRGAETVALPFNPDKPA